jgi:hypothetical protein
MTNHFAKYEDAVKKRKRQEDIDLFVIILGAITLYVMLAGGLFASIVLNIAIGYFLTPWLLIITIPATIILLAAWITLIAKINKRFELF